MRRNVSTRAEFSTLNTEVHPRNIHYNRRNGPGMLEVPQSPGGADSAKEGEQYAKTTDTVQERNLDTSRDCDSAKTMRL